MNTQQGRSSGASRQQGVVILMMMLLALSISSYVVLKALNSRSSAYTAERIKTRYALQDAKLALIGYALNYADGTHAPGKGPGHLPCPDHDAAGAPGSSDTVPDCTENSGNETGRFPWRTLGMDDIRDASGAPLWYAVSSSYRSMANSPLNSETEGTLRIGDSSDIVAVIIAPGEELSDQARASGHEYNPADFLEGDNAITGKKCDAAFDPDKCFATFEVSGDEAFNDQVVFITRGELMAAVEKMVIKEVARALENYFSDPDGDDDGSGRDPDCPVEPDCDDGFPWLADFGHPPPHFGASPATYVAGVPDLTFGYLPLVYVKDNEDFNADFSMSWNIDAAGEYIPAIEEGKTPPDEACLRSSANCEVPGFPGLMIESPVTGKAGGSWSQGVCTLNGLTVLSCTATYSSGAGLRRIYRFAFNSNVKLQEPTPDLRRGIGVRIADSWSGAEATLTVTDYDPAGDTEIGSAALIIGSLDPGDDIHLTVPFDLQVSQDVTVQSPASPGELPNWFYANNWHQLVLVKYGAAEAPGMPAATCVADDSCLTVSLLRPGATAPTAMAAVRGIVLSAGAALAHQSRPAVDPDAYLEDANAHVTESFIRQEASAAFNDQLIILDPR